MLLACPAFRVALVTTHVPLRAVADLVTPDRVSGAIELLCRGLGETFGLTQPRVKVLALNPHAGEGGHLGHEEQTVLAPVITDMQRRWPGISGPHSADTAFVSESGDGPDAYLGMYHDQVLGVLKYAGFGRSANITLGLPYVRTSVDHGTALDISGTGKASATSFAYAIDCALDAIAHRKRKQHATTG
jgi:4-hydroxythreonine-4-phosphate dehydrogenase